MWIRDAANITNLHTPPTVQVFPLFTPTGNSRTWGALRLLSLPRKISKELPQSSMLHGHLPPWNMHECLSDNREM